MSDLNRHPEGRTERETLRATVAELEGELVRLRTSHAELARRESRRRFLCDNGPGINALLNPAGEIMQINARAAARGGFTPDEIIGRKAAEFVHREDRCRFEQGLERVLAGEGEQSMQVRVVLGDDVWTFQVSQGPAEIDGESEPLGVHVVAMDITEQKHAERELARQRREQRVLREQLRALSDVAHELARADTFDFLCRRAVELGREKLGFDRMSVWFITGRPGEARGSFGTNEKGRTRDERDCLVPVSPSSLMGTALAQRTSRAVVGPAKLRDHRAHVIAQGVVACASLWDGEQIIGCIAADNLLRHEPITSKVRDLLNAYASVLGPLCSRARALESLRTSEEAYRALVESANETIATVDADGVLLFMNGVAAARLGGTPGDFIGKTMWDLFPPEVADRQMQEVRGVIETGEGAVVEAPTIVAGQDRFFRTSFQPLRQGEMNTRAVLLLATDMTPQREAEQALRASEERYRMLAETMNEGLAQIDADGRITWVNDRLCELIGRSRSELIGVRGPDLCDPASREKIEEELAKRRQGGTDSYELVFPHADGTRRTAQVSPRPLYDAEGRYIGSLGVFTDITERKRMEERLRRSELLYRTTVDGLDDSVHVVTQDLRITLANRTFRDWCGRFGLGEDISGRSILEVCPFVPESVAGEYRQVFETRKTMLTEDVNVVAGQEVITETRKIPILEDGRVVRVITVVRNITERKQAEQALRLSEERMRLILENTSDGIDICELDMDSSRRRLVICNDRFVEMSGRSREELMSAENLNDLTVCHDSPEEARRNRERKRQYLPYGGLGSWVRPDGKENYFEWTAAPIRRGDEVYIVGIDRDVTDRRRAEEELLIRNSAMQSSISAVALFETAGGLRYVNPAFVELWGYDSEEEIYSRGRGRALWQDMDRARRIEDAVLDTGRWRGEIVARRKDGTPFEVAAGISLVSNHAGEPVCLMGSFLDISPRKRAEAAMRVAHSKLTAAREVERHRLAGELHDSVGQGLVALHLGLQGLSRYVSGPGHRLREMAGQCGGLIREIRAICRGLYPPTLASLGLCAALTQLAEEFSSHAQIAVSCPILDGPGQFPPDVEIALFRIAQEAVNNAVRHGKACRIDVDLSHEKGWARLIVTDDGPGFDPQLAAGSKGLGLNMMRERVLAIGGHIEMDGTPGRSRIIATAPSPFEPRPPAGGK